MHFIVRVFDRPRSGCPRAFGSPSAKHEDCQSTRTARSRPVKVTRMIKFNFYHRAVCNLTPKLLFAERKTAELWNFDRTWSLLLHLDTCFLFWAQLSPSCHNITLSSYWWFGLICSQFLDDLFVTHSCRFPQKIIQQLHACHLFQLSTKGFLWSKLYFLHILFVLLLTLACIIFQIKSFTKTAWQIFNN